VRLLEDYSLSLWQNLVGKLRFDLAYCGIGKEISAFIGFLFLFHVILV
jgi:hypothetical protein